MKWENTKIANKPGRYLVTAINGVTKEPYVTVAELCDCSEDKLSWCYVMGGQFIDRITAWQEMPAPYCENIPEHISG